MKITSGEFGKFFSIMRITSALSRAQEKNLTWQIWSTTKEPRNVSALSLKEQNSLGYSYCSVKIQLKQVPNDVDVESEVKLALCISADLYQNLYIGLQWLKMNLEVQKRI